MCLLLAVLLILHTISISFSHYFEVALSGRIKAKNPRAVCAPLVISLYFSYRFGKETVLLSMGVTLHKRLLCFESA